VTRENSPLLEIRQLNQHYRGRGLFRAPSLHVLKNIELTLYPGEIVALVGESGSGKSTLLKVIARLSEPSSGKIFWKGQDLLAVEPKRASLGYRGEVQMVFQDPFASLNPFHTVAYTLGRPLRRHGFASSPDAAETRSLDLLSAVGLAPPREFLRKYPHQLSGGQRQRIAIARALAVSPSLILADEPVSMLDVSIRIGVLNLLDDLRRTRGISMLFVTHDLASARYLADRIVVLYQGEIVEQGPSEELLAAPRHAYTKLLLASAAHRKPRALGAKNE
jgi:peptide/nickel transport system ATP-binding protein